MLTIVTVVHKNLDGILTLYQDLAPFLSSDLQWIIKDSGHSVELVNWYNSLKDENIFFYSSFDSGIYDALNFTIPHVSSEFYLVIGSDDRVIGLGLCQLVTNIKNGIYSNFNFISLPVYINGVIYNRRKYIPISWSISSLIASHSCGLVIKTSLHKKIGFYSTQYKILSDSLFILKAHRLGYKIFYEKLIVGYFSSGGISSSLTLMRSIEAFRIQIECKSFFLLQVFYFLIRFGFFKVKKLLSHFR